jgi:hypothetical protein
MAKAKKTKKSKKQSVTKGKKRLVHKKVAAKKAPKKSRRISKTSTKKPKRKSQKSSAWQISPEKHGTTDVWVFKKDGVTIEVSQTYRFSYIIVAHEPDLTKYDPDKGINIDNFDYSHYEPGDDSYGPNWTFPDDFPSEEQERIKSLWDEEHLDGLMEAGWTCDDGTYFYGPLSVEEVESESPDNSV